MPGEGPEVPPSPLSPLSPCGAEGGGGARGARGAGRYAQESNLPETDLQSGASTAQHPYPRAMGPRPHARRPPSPFGASGAEPGTLPMALAGPKGTRRERDARPTEAPLPPSPQGPGAPKGTTDADERREGRGGWQGVERSGSNRQPTAPQTVALTIELQSTHRCRHAGPRTPAGPGNLAPSGPERGEREARRQGQRTANPNGAKEPPIQGGLQPEMGTSSRSDAPRPVGVPSRPHAPRRGA